MTQEGIAMIDLHSHILPQMDDGSKSPKESSQLLDMLGQQGVSIVAATPHFYPNLETPQAFLERREIAAARLPVPTTKQPQILMGAEVAYFSGIGNCEDIIPLQIGNTKLLLIEMPFYSWSPRIVDEICRIPMQLGLIPVLAHVNRYRHKGQFPTYMQTLSENGALFQCNAEVFQTITGRRWAAKLLKNGYLHFLGSDCHNLTDRSPQLIPAEKFMQKTLGVSAWEQWNRNVENLILDNS